MSAPTEATLTAREARARAQADEAEQAAARVGRELAGWRIEALESDGRAYRCECTSCGHRAVLTVREVFDGEPCLRCFATVEPDVLEETAQRLVRLSTLPTVEAHGEWTVDESAWLAENGPATLEEVGRVVGLSRERVRQIEAEALAKLRKALAAEGVDAITALADLIGGSGRYRFGGG